MAGRTYVHQLDAKNRMRIPAKLREEIGKNYTIMAGSGGCLYVYNEEQAKRLNEKLQHVNPFNEKQLKAARLLLSLSWDAEEDKQGRILIPDNIREYVNIKKNVVVFNGPNCVEIWAEEVWNEREQNRDYEKMREIMRQHGL